MGALTQEERESVTQEIGNEEWQQPTSHMIETIKCGVMRSEKGIATVIGEKGKDRTHQNTVEK